MYRDFRDQNTVFDGVLARFPAPLTLMTGGQAERVNGELVTGNYFDVLGVRAHIGRTFTQDDDRTPGGHPVAILTHSFWTRRFARDPGVLNRSVTLNGQPMTIVGVTPPGFFGIVVGESPDVLVPVMMKAQMTPTWDDLLNRRSRWLTVMARLKPGVSAEQAESAMNVIYRQINEQELKEIQNPSQSFRERFVSKHLFLRPGQKGRSDLRQQFSTPILVLMGMVGLVLLIACANVANLLLARGAARQKEVAIRLALGASRGAIVRQRLIESLVLAAAGAVLGLAFAWWTGALLLKMLPFDAGAQTLSASPDVRVDRVRVRGGAADGAPLRPGAGAAVDAARARVDAEGRIGQRRGRHRARAVPKRARRRAGRAVGAAARRRRAVRAQPLQPQDASTPASRPTSSSASRSIRR